MLFEHSLVNSIMAADKLTFVLNSIPSLGKACMSKLEMHSVECMYLQQRCSNDCRVTCVWTTVTPFSPYHEEIITDISMNIRNAQQFFC